MNKYNKYINRKRAPQHIQYNGTNRILDQKSIDFVADNFNFKSSFRIFDQEIDILQIPEWHRDICSGEEFPMIYCRDINTRTHPRRSAKFVWEINRLQYLTQIAYAYRKTKERDYLNLFINHLNSWIDSNPFLIGVNWYSNIELNVRLITWFLCWEIIEIESLMKTNQDIHNFVMHKWLPVIYLHCKQTVRNPSKFSSANNHLISEYAGLFVASSFWKFKESEKWMKLTKKGLEEEIVRQHTNDGINREQTSEYIQFITDFFLISYVIAEKTGNMFNSDFKDTLHKIFDYISVMLDSKGNTPKYGDEDDGRCFMLETESDFDNFHSLLVSGAILFEKGKWKSNLSNIDSKNIVLLGLSGKDIYDKIRSEPDSPRSKFYPESGHFYIKDRQDDKDVYIHFDAASLGYLSIAAHGHADALSFVLHLNGQPFIIDPGTYTYHTDKEFRNYFKGTLAHNTIRIAEQNQATIGGPTMWREHYEVKIHSIVENKDEEVVRASHNGYFIKIGIIHTRTLVFDKKKLALSITDDIECNRSTNPYSVEFPLHLHPEIMIESTQGSVIMLKTGNISKKVKITTDSKLKYITMKGSMNPILGWYSKSFNYKTACNTLYGKGLFTGNQQFITTFEII